MQKIHENARLLQRFFESVQAHDHPATAACYHPSATFEDIAFYLKENKRIHAMWHMISLSDLELSYEIEDADDLRGTARWQACYTFESTDEDRNRKVHNELKSRFTFKDGLISQQVDDSNAWNWSMQALGPVNGFVAWLIPAVRRGKAMEKLDKFIEEHPQYR